MIRLLACRRGQAFTELALVLFLFFLFIMGLMQLVMLGRAQIQLQHAARRAAVVYNVWNNAAVRDQDQAQIQALLPGCNVDSATGGNDEGTTVKVSYVVPAIGFFRLARPGGFKLTCQSAAIAYNPEPKAGEWIKKGAQAVTDLVTGH